MTNLKVDPKDRSFLAVDLDKKFLKKTHEYLVMAGAHTVRTCNTSHEALDILRTTKPSIDCILCAEDLAPVAGIRFLKELRCGRHGETPHIRGVKFILVTAHREMDLVSAAKALDVDGYIVKPVDFKSFARHLHEGLAHTIDLKAPAVYSAVDISSAERLPVILTEGQWENPNPRRGPRRPTT